MPANTRRFALRMPRVPQGCPTLITERHRHTQRSSNGPAKLLSQRSPASPTWRASNSVFPATVGSSPPILCSVGPVPNTPPARAARSLFRIDQRTAPGSSARSAATGCCGFPPTQSAPNSVPRHPEVVDARGPCRRCRRPKGGGAPRGAAPDGGHHGAGAENPDL